MSVFNDLKRTETAISAFTPDSNAAYPKGGDYRLAFERYRPELVVHCYRMTGSLIDAEDLVQETFLKAWRHRDHYQQRSSMRTWLYRIATNASLDHLRAAARRVRPVGLGAAALDQVSWLEPIPDHLLDQTDPSPGPELAAVSRETIGMAFLAALQHLPPRQRAAFIARDVLSMSAHDTALLLDGSVASVNSLTQRARAKMKMHAGLADQQHRSPSPAEEEAELLKRYMDAHEAGDVEALLDLIHADVRMAMPPEPSVDGNDNASKTLTTLLDPNQTGSWRLVPVRVNRQPAAATYLQATASKRYRANSIDVLTATESRIAVIDTFLGPRWFQLLGLPLEWQTPT